ncbi:MAG: GC-type dockerin domain-anchored protein [Phycisphaerales bacterium]
MKLAQVAGIGMFVTFAAAAAQAGVVVELSPPAGDRWNYPFAGNGAEATLPIFAAMGRPGFDDRDGEASIFWQTGAEVPAGFLPGQYRVVSAAVFARAYVSGPSLQFAYDPTQDAVQTYYATDDAEYVADTDADRPIELFAAGFRNMGTLAAYTETSPFTTGAPLVPPAEGARDMYPVFFSAAGLPVDASRNVRLRYEAEPLAVGTTSLTPGELVVNNTDFTFNINLGLAGVRQYVQSGLAGGKLAFVVTALMQAQDFGGGVYPRLYSKEATTVAYPGSAPARLRLDVTLCVSDVAGLGGTAGPDGQLTADDVIAYLNGFFSGDTQTADVAVLGGAVGKDGQLTADDIIVFLNSFFGGCQ